MPRKIKCPLVGEECWEHECTWYIHLIGKSPQTGEALDEWGCAISWLPVLQIEGAQESRQAAAAVESMRNEIVKRMDTPIRLPPSPQQRRLNGD